MYLPTAWIVGAALMAAAAEPETALRRIDEQVLADLARLPNYTCTETIERSQRASSAKQFEPIDRVRLEIALVSGNELFGWPGGEKIAEDDITRLVAGFVGNGDFATQLRELFTRPSAQFRLIGEETRSGHTALRYDYRVPLSASGWRLRAAAEEIPIGYHGTLWVDKDSLQLIELNTNADDLPRSLGFLQLSKSLGYTQVRIGSSQFLLPARGTMLTTDLTGQESRNETRFHDCRQYSAQSTISFDPTPTGEAGANTGAEGAPGALPYDFDLNLTLETGIDSDTAAVGDTVTARVDQAIKNKGTTVIPKGALWRADIPVGSGARAPLSGLVRDEHRGGRQADRSGEAQQPATTDYASKPYPACGFHSGVRQERLSHRS